MKTELFRITLKMGMKNRVELALWVSHRWCGGCGYKKEGNYVVDSRNVNAVPSLPAKRGNQMLKIGPEMIAWLERKQAAYLWGQKRFIKPVFIEQALGNGDLLLAVTPLNTRPNYYLIRIDSNWLKKDDTETIYDHLDEIEDAIEDVVGCRDYEDDEGNECLAEWPSLNSNAGVSWCNSNDLIDEFNRRNTKRKQRAA